MMVNCMQNPFDHGLEEDGCAEMLILMMMAHFSQKWIVGKVDGQFLHARWCL